MGCDIHWVLEVKYKDKWIGLINSGSVYFLASERWYSFFTELGLEHRGKSSTAISLNGFPHDASDLAIWYYKDWGVDAHSASHLSIKEFIAIYNRAQEDIKPTNARNLFGGHFSPDDDKEYRVVFWFDN